MSEKTTLFNPEHNSVEISRLINSHLYFLEIVLIRKSNAPHGCYLEIYNHKRTVYNKFYPSLRGAKIAFSKYFGRRTRLEIIPAWSCFYQPDKDWLEKLFLQEREANHES